MRLTFDCGEFSWSPDRADDPARTYTMVHDDIGGGEAKLPISMEAGSGYACAYFVNLGGPGLNPEGEGLTPEQRQTARAVFRSIHMSGRESLDNPQGEYSMAPRPHGIVL